MGTLTVLSHQSCALVKRWRADGTIAPYDQAKTFTLHQPTIDSFRDLTFYLESIEHDPHTCVIRGTPTEATLAHANGQVWRRAAHFTDAPIHPILIEVDGYEPLTADPLTHPALCCWEYIQVRLPLCFHEASYHWQLSNSAGRPTHAGRLKVHLWFWLETPYTSAQLKAWAKSLALDCDHSVFHKIQIHYTGRPLFDPGVRDPVPVGSGVCEAPSDTVPLVIDPSILAQVETARVVKDRDASATTPAAHDDTVSQYLAEHGWVVGRAAGRVDLRCPFASAHTAGGDPTATSYFLEGTGGFSQGHFTCLHAHCRARGDRDFLEAIGYQAWFTTWGMEALPDEVGSGPGIVEALVGPVGGSTTVSPIVGPRFVLHATTRLPKVLEVNISEALLHPTLYTLPVVRYDRFLDLTTVDTPTGPRPLTDIDISTINYCLSRHQFGPGAIPHSMINSAVAHVASLRAYDSAIDWLASLHHDGVPRIAAFCSRYLGSEDTPYHRALSRYWWTAHAGRVMTPGVQADAAIILVSKQGTGKTSTAKRLVPSESQYVAINLGKSEADNIRRMRGKLVCELAELSGLKSRDLETIKSIISATHDSHVEKYEKRSKDLSRRIVFVGSSNNDDFLSDPTGNRRFLPLYVGERQDLEAIARDRDQLWAEGRDLFLLLGDVDWREVQQLVLDEHPKFDEDDPWDDTVFQWLDDAHNWLKTTSCYAPSGAPLHGETRETQYVTIARVLHEALHIDTARQVARDMHRVKRLLVRYGLEKVVIRVAGRQQKAWKNKTDTLLP